MASLDIFVVLRIRLDGTISKQTRDVSCRQGWCVFLARGKKFKELSSHGFRSVNAKQAKKNRNGESCVRFNDVFFFGKPGQMVSLFLSFEH